MLWLGEFGQSQWRIGKSSKSMRRCSQNSTVIMLHLSAWLYCRAESLCYNGKSALSVCARVRLILWDAGDSSPSWIPGKRHQLDLTRQTAHRQTRYVPILAPSNFLPSFFFFFLFGPSFLSSLCLSAPSSLSLSRFILPLPVIRAL